MVKMEKINDECGFEFSGAGEFRNCNCYLDNNNKWISICPKCGKKYKSDN